MQIRYTALIQRLSRDFPEAPSEFWPQTLTRWKKRLGVKQPRPGWYDEEDYVGLKALGEAYRRHQLRGSDAKDYAISKVETWRNQHGYRYE
jgi:hypothetical protein